MLISDDTFQIELTPEGWRCFNFERKQLGEVFQAQCRTIEWKAASIVFEKYKRAYNLTHEDLISLKTYIEQFSAARKASGKSVNKDYLTQIASAEIKRLHKCHSASVATGQLL